MVNDTLLGSCFNLNIQPQGGIKFEEAELYHEIDVTLLSLEDLILNYRLAFGWSQSTFELLGIPREAVFRRFSDVLGDTGEAFEIPCSVQTGGHIDPSTSDATAKLDNAAQLIASGAYDEAISAFREIAESCPEHRGTCFQQIGDAHFFVGRYKEAITWYEVALIEGADRVTTRSSIDEARRALEGSS